MFLDFHDTQTWVTLSFLVFLFIMWKVAWAKISVLLDNRISLIKKEIDTAESLRIEAQELLAQYQRKQRDAKKEADEIIQAAKDHAKAIQKEAEAGLKEAAKRKEEQLTERLQRMEENAKSRIRNYAADLAMKATTELIAQQLDKKTNENLIADAVSDLKKSAQ